MNLDHHPSEPADSELRRAKRETHAAFDPIWKEKHKSRTGAYEWLASVLGIEVTDCHIGMFDIDTCRLATRLSDDKLFELRRRQWLKKMRLETST